MRRDPPHQILHTLASGFRLRALALSLTSRSICLSPMLPFPLFFPDLFYILNFLILLLCLAFSHVSGKQQTPRLSSPFPLFLPLFFSPPLLSIFLHRSHVFNTSCLFKWSQRSRSSHLLFFLLFSHMSLQMIGLNTSVLQGRSTTTTAGRRCLSGRNPKSGWRGIKHAHFQPILCLIIH